MTSAADGTRAKPKVARKPNGIKHRALSIVYGLAYPLAMTASAIEHYRKGGTITTGEALAATVGWVFCGPCLVVSAFAPEAARQSMLSWCDDRLGQMAAFIEGQP